MKTVSVHTGLAPHYAGTGSHFYEGDVSLENALIQIELADAWDDEITVDGITATAADVLMSIADDFGINTDPLETYGEVWDAIIDRK